MYPRSPLRSAKQYNAGTDISPFNIGPSQNAYTDRGDYPYQKDSSSQYSTNNTQMKESLQIQLPEDELYPARPNESTLNFRLAPSTPTRTRYASPFSKTPNGGQNYAPRSPGLSPIGKSPLLDKSRNSFLQTQDLSGYSHLEPQTMMAEEFRQEKAINSELIRSARGLSEMAKLLKNALVMLRKDAPGANNFVVHALSKSESHQLEVEDSKRRLREVHMLVL